MGNTTPHWFGGFNTTLTWKGLTLYGRFDFALDYWIYDNTTPWFLGCMQGGYNTTTDVFNTWSEENPNAKYPRYVWADQLGTANYYRTSTMFAYKGNYLAIREISLSYSLPQNIARKFYCQKLDVSVTGQNLGYITYHALYSSALMLHFNNLKYKKYENNKINNYIRHVTGSIWWHNDFMQ